jgi:hypothetical protein
VTHSRLRTAVLVDNAVDLALLTTPALAARERIRCGLVMAPCAAAFVALEMPRPDERRREVTCRLGEELLASKCDEGRNVRRERIREDRAPLRDDRPEKLIEVDVAARAEQEAVHGEVCVEQTRSTHVGVSSALRDDVRRLDFSPRSDAAESARRHCARSDVAAKEHPTERALLHRAAGGHGLCFAIVDGHRRMRRRDHLRRGRVGRPRAVQLNVREATLDLQLGRVRLKIIGITDPAAVVHRDGLAREIVNAVVGLQVALGLECHEKLVVGIGHDDRIFLALDVPVLDGDGERSGRNIVLQAALLKRVWQGGVGWGGVGWGGVGWGGGGGGGVGLGLFFVACQSPCTSSECSHRCKCPPKSNLI